VKLKMRTWRDWRCRLLGHRWHHVKEWEDMAPGSYDRPGQPLHYTSTWCPRCGAASLTWRYL